MMLAGLEERYIHRIERSCLCPAWMGRSPQVVVALTGREL